MSVSSTSSTAVNNIYSSIAAKNKGLGGLVSGLDTESLVEALTLSTRSKIAKQQQNRQSLVWKQAGYQSCVDSLKGFQTKYYDKTKDIRNQMTHRNWYNIYKASSSNDAIKVDATGSSMPGTIEIEKILSKASYATAQSAPVDNRLVSKSGTNFLNPANPYTNQTLTLYLDNSTGSTYTIDLSSLDTIVQTPVPSATYPTLDDQQKDFRQTLENLITDQVGRKPNPSGVPANEVPIITVDINWGVGGVGELELKSDLNRITLTSSVEELGLSSGFSNRISTTDKICDIFPNLVGAGYQGNDLIFKINGQTVTVKATDKLTDVLSRINNTKDANVKISYDQVTQTFSMVSTKPGANIDLTFEDVQGNLLNQMFGTAGGSTFMTEVDTSKNTMGYLMQSVNGSKFIVDPLAIPPKDGIADLMSILAALDGTAGKLTVTIGDETKTITFGGADMDLAAIQQSVEIAMIKAALDSDDQKVINDYMNHATQKAAIETEMRNWLDSNFSISTNYEDLSDLDKAVYNTYKTAFTNDMYIDFVADAGAVHGHGLQAKVDTYKGTQDGIDEETKLLANEIVKLVNGAITKEFGALQAGLVYNSATKDFCFGLTSTTSDLYFSVGPGGSGTDLFTDLGFDTVAVGGVVSNYDPSKATTLADLGVKSFGNLYIDDPIILPPLTPPSTPIPLTANMTLHDLRALIEAQGASMTVGGGVITIDTKGQELLDQSGEDGFLNKVLGIHLDEVTGDAAYTPSAATASLASLVTEGVNAAIQVNGQVMVSESNTFSINGVNFTVEELYDGTDGNIVITVEVDATDLVDKLQEWIDDYNNMYSLLNGLVTEQTAKDDDGKATYKPLTDEQKAEMTEKQIEEWEEKAKKGLLQNDPTLRRICEQLRKTIYNTVYDIGLAPYEIGISTVSLYNSSAGSVSSAESGMLTLDQDKLKAALETNGELVISMFTSTTKGPDGEPNGLAHQLFDVIDAAINESSVQEPPGSGIYVSRGTLIQLIGTGDKLTGDNTSMIGTRIENIDKQISRLKLRLEQEYNRYWKQFSALETAIARMNSQSSWLMEQSA